MNNPLAAALAQAIQPFEPLPWTPPGHSPRPPPPLRRPKLWELGEKHHCPVIGTCLPVAELRRFARRFELLADPRDEYALHVEAVQLSMHRNAFSEALHDHFEREFASAVRRFKEAKDDAGVRALWAACLERGEVAGPLWAALTHKAVSGATRQRIFADIHMLSHQVGAGKAADARRLSFLERENQALRNEQQEERRRAARREAEQRERIAALERERTALSAQAREAALLRERLAAYEHRGARQRLEQRLSEAEQANARLRERLQRQGEMEQAFAEARAEIARLEAERQRIALERDALERMLEPAECGGCECPEVALLPQRDGLPRCVLCVGGRPSLVAQYRALAERAGLRLLHHDGGREEAIARLPELINGADAVLCPTDCVSHTAYYQVKRQCRQAGIPCLFYQGAGVSSFALALARLSAGECSLGREEEKAPST